ncbi:MAG: NAD-binding protein [Rhodobacteraceae bacterium]|nr:NAD-binding protein [Paracoccaceae bacterium]
MRVGFAGLGRMGRPMARNIAHAGHDLVLWNRSAQAAQDLADALGGTHAETPHALADNVDVVVTMLADDAASGDVHFGPDGLFQGGRAKTCIEMGTMSPDHIHRLAAAAPQGVTVIDAPVSGATQAALDAQLLIMAGCTQDEATQFAPLFDTMGRQTIALGRTGAGAVMKLAVNAMLHGINQTLAEANGIAADQAFDVIEASAACAPMLKYRRPLYLDEAGHDVTFTVALAHKDMRVTADLAAAQNVAMPQSAVTQSVLSQAMQNGFSERDMAAILNYMRKTKP